MVAQPRYSDLDFQNSSRVLNLPAPVNASDAATKAYVDSSASGGGLTAGNDGQVLRTSSSGSIEFENDFNQVAVIAGNYYPPDTIITGNSASTLPANNLFLLPFFRGGKFDAISIFLSSVGSGGAARVGLYDSLSTGLPGNLIEEPTVTTQLNFASGTGVKTSLFATPRIITKPSWIAFLGNGAGATGQGSSATNKGAQILGQALTIGSITTITVALEETFVYAALPSSLSGVSWSQISGNGNYPLIFLRGSI